MTRIKRIAKKVLALLKLQIDNKTDILKTASPKSMTLTALRALLFVVLATLGVGFGIYRVIGIGIVISTELLAIVLLATQAISLIFALGNILNTLYLSKDNQMLICLPITANYLFLSKIIMIYLKELIVNSAIVVPLFLSLSTFADFGPSFYLSLPVLLLFLPVLPIVIAAFLSVPVMILIRFLKKHPVLAILAIFGFVALCLWIYVSLIGALVGEFDIAGKQFETVKKINAALTNFGKQIPIYYTMAKTMDHFFANWLFYPIYFVSCLVIAFITVLFTKHFFFKIAMSHFENTVRAVPKKKPFKHHSKFTALFLKEALCILRSPSDLFEYFLFTVMMPFIVFTYDSLLMSINVNQVGINMVAGAHVMVVALLAMLSNISSASAISRDGENFYTSKIIPVNYYSQIFAKFAFNAVFTFGSLLVTAVVSAFVYPLWQVLLGTLAIAMASAGHIALCINTDIKNPTTSLQGNEGASTVSKSTTRCLIYGLLIGFVLGITVMLMSAMENAVIPYLVIIAAALVFMVYNINNLILRINLAYDKIEL